MPAPTVTVYGTNEFTYLLEGSPLHPLRWADGLLSLPQGKNALRKTSGYCCLGGACELFNPAGWGDERVSVTDGIPYEVRYTEPASGQLEVYDGAVAFLPAPLHILLGISRQGDVRYDIPAGTPVGAIDPVLYPVLTERSVSTQDDLQHQLRLQESATFTGPFLDDDLIGVTTLAILNDNGVPFARIRTLIHYPHTVARHAWWANYGTLYANPE